MREYRTRGIQSRAAIGEHPIHPMLIPLPIGFLIGALAADGLFWITDDPFFARAALWLTAGGVLSGALAAIFGLIDFLGLEAVRSYRIAWYHFLGNALAIALAAVSWIGRANDPTGFALPWGLTLSVAWSLILTFTGWWGGELSYRHGIGVTGERNERPSEAGSAA